MVAILYVYIVVLYASLPITFPVLLLLWFPSVPQCPISAFMFSTILFQVSSVRGMLFLHVEDGDPALHHCLPSDSRELCKDTVLHLSIASLVAEPELNFL